MCSLWKFSLSAILLFSALHCSGHPSHVPAIVKVVEIQSPVDPATRPLIRLSLVPTHASQKLLIRARASGLGALIDPSSNGAQTDALTIDLGAVEANVAREVALQLASNDGYDTGTIRLFIEAQDAAGWPTGAMELNFSALLSDGKFFVAAGDLLPLRQAAIGELERTGKITAEDSLRRRRELTTYRKTVELPRPPEPRTASVRALPTLDIIIPGTVEWRDITSGTLWPVAGMKLQAIWKSSDTGNERILGETTTDFAGNYSLIVPSNSVPTNNPFTLILRAETRADRFQLKSPGTFGTVYTYEQQFTNVVGQFQLEPSLPNFIIFDKVNAAGEDVDKHRVWAVYSALYLASSIVDTSFELRLMSSVTCHFPSDNGKSYAGNIPIPGTGAGIPDSMSIARSDYADFDVILHEFGHMLAKTFDWDDSVAGEHNGSMDLILQTNSKEIGVPLAWTEGVANVIPTIFATELSKRHGKGLAPRFHDQSYDDVENTEAKYAIETNPGVADPLELNSEANEFTVARVLFDLYDGGSVLEPYDRVSWGAETFFAELRNAQVGTLDGFWDYLTRGQLPPNEDHPTTVIASLGPRVIDLYAPLFAGNNVAPMPISPSGTFVEEETESGRVVRFRFWQNMNQVRGTLTEFRILFVIPGGKVVAYSEPASGGPDDVLTITIPATSMQQALALAEGNPLSWTVVGVDNAAPVTGAYVGPLHSLELSSQLYFVIDTTASMQPEISGVRDGLLSFLKRFDPKSSATKFQLITFKDDVNVLPPTTDLSVIQSQIAALTAEGGDAVPEASVEALWQVARTAVGTTGGRPTVFLATDAPPHDFLSIIATTALLRTLGVRVNTLLTEQDASLRARSQSQSQAATRSEFGFTGEVKPVPDIDILTLYPANDFSSATDAYGQISDGTGGVLLKRDKFDSAALTAAAENLTAGGIFPSVVQTLPLQAPAGTTLDLLIQGQNTNFDASSTVSFSNTAITVNSVSVRSPIELSANITIGTGALTAPSDVTVKTANESAVGVRVFKVNEPTSSPLLLSVSPFRGERGSTLTVTMLGVNTSFTNTSTVSFGDQGITVTAVNALSLTTLQATIEIAPDAAVEFRTVTVDGLTQRAAFRVASAPPAFPLIRSILPSAITPGETLDLLLTGENTAFTAESTASFSGSGLTVNSVTLVSPTELRVNVTAALDAPPTFRDVFVTTAGNVVSGLQLLKVINTAPIIDPLDIDGDGILNEFDNDMDGDGVPNAIETQLGFDPTNPASAPAPAITVSVPVRKVSLKLSFTKSGRDSFSFSGTLPLAVGTPLTGRTLVFDVGGISATVVSGSPQFKLSKPRKGESRYIVKFVKQDLAASLAAAGFGPNQNFPVDIPVSLAFEGQFLQQSLPADFKSNAKTGSLR
ncbi:MAG TPA: VWA domain-containing protein [Planctomycetota bacterium]|nr:VWA domain-containing protein [Planctomycetota bacterium]